ncbi:MAG: cytochrome c [Acidobacteriota bacterium]
MSDSRRTQAWTAAIGVAALVWTMGAAAGPVAVVTAARAQAPAAASVWSGVYTEAQAARGMAIYKQRCISCHGDKLDGGMGPSIAGPDFMAEWQGRSASDLFERTQLTMPLDDPGKLTPKEVADLLAYVFSVNTFPAGQAELPADRDALAPIRIQASK